MSDEQAFFKQMEASINVFISNVIAAEEQHETYSVVSFTTLSTFGDITEVFNDESDIQLDEIDNVSLCSISDFIDDHCDIKLNECDVEHDEDIDENIIDTLID